MKRDMELIRKMVMLMDDAPTGFVSGGMVFEGFTEEQIGYHAYLIFDAGLAQGSDATDMDSSGPDYSLSHLTSAGHDFADSVRTEYIWNEVWADMQKKGMKTATLDVLKKLLDNKIKKYLDVD